MSEAVAELFQAIRELAASPGLDVQTEGAETVSEVGGDAAAAAEMFETIHGRPCPPSLRPGLLLPDTLAVNWARDAKVAGEFTLANILFAMRRTLDESMHEWEMNGVRLADARVLDAVVLRGGPLYTLLRVTEAGVSEQLYVFNTRELFELELGYEEYLRRLSLTKGLVEWQYLYCRGLRLRGFEKAALKRGIEFLRAAFPGRDYEELESRWAEKGA